MQSQVYLHLQLQLCSLDDSLMDNQLFKTSGPLQKGTNRSSFDNKLPLLWVLSHCGLRSNIEADKLGWIEPSGVGHKDFQPIGLQGNL